MKITTKKLTSKLLFSMMLSIFSLTTSEWKVSTESNNVTIFKSSSETLKYDVFKVDALIARELNQLDSVLNECRLLSRWFPMCKEATVLNRADNTTRIYMIFDFPFPLKDRDALIEVTRIQDADQLTFTLQTINGAVTPNSEFIRIEDIQSNTILSIGNHGVMVEQFIYLDPGGTIPRLFLHEGLPKELVKSFKKLNKLAS